MTTQTCTIPFVRAALLSYVTALDLRFADDANEKVGVSIGEPADGFRREHVMIGEVPESGSEQRFRLLGFKTRDEEYELDVVVSVSQPGKTPKEASERAYVILAAIEAKLRESNESVVLGLASRGVRQVEVTSPADVLIMDEDGGHCAVKWTLRVKADLRVTA